MPLLFLRAEWGEARQLAEVTCANGSPVERQLAMMLLGLIAREQGDTRLVRSSVRELLPDGPATTPGGRLFACGIEMQRLAAAIALDDGDLSAARAWLEAHDAWLSWSGSLRGRAESRLLWAEYAGAVANRRQAYEHAQAALELAASPRQPLVQLAARRLLARFYLTDGLIDDAAAQVDAAMQLVDACAAPYERALVFLARAELQIAMQRHDRARADLDEVRTLCAPIGAKRALDRAEELARQMVAISVAPPANLSAREVEVLRLVAEGLTDIEVAARLFISPRTVGQHLRSIYNKLGVSSRASATRLAVEHGLTD